LFISLIYLNLSFISTIILKYPHKTGKRPVAGLFYFGGKGACGKLFAVQVVLQAFTTSAAAFAGC
jgi:hypothetical protein